MAAAGLLQNFVTRAGDFEFSFVRADDLTGTWTRKLLNVAGAQPEEIASPDELPKEVLREFSAVQVEKQSVFNG